MECSGEALICLICGKENDLENSVLVNNESALKFKRCFLCFCQLLSADNKAGEQLESILNGAIKCVGSEGGSGLEQAAFKLPSCVECHQALDEINRLQDAIIKMKLTQTDLLDGLKLNLLNPEEDELFQDSGLLRIRKQLVACILKQDEPRVEPANKPKLEENVEQEPVSSDDDDDMSGPNDSGDNQSDQDYFPCHPSPGCDNPVIVTEPEAKVVQAADGPRPPKKKGDLNNAYFSKLSSSLLLYKSTVIKVTPRKGLICQEPSCFAHLANGTDFDSLEAVKVHVNTAHFEEKVYLGKVRECPLCEDEFEGACEFRKHLLSKFHGRPPYICHCCGRPFSKYSMMAPHLRSHRGAGESTDDLDDRRRKFACDQCFKEFYKSNALAAHKQSHLPKHLRNQISCDQCPKTFLSQTALRIHVERFHQTRKYRSCHLCKKQFFWRESHKLAVHMKSHGTLPPHVCDQCGKAFYAPQLLKTHLQNVHPEGDLRHQCEYCEMSYKIKRGLIRHQQRHHKDKVAPVDPELSLRQKDPEHRPDFIGPKIAFPCQFCEKPFPLKCRLTQHLKKYHADMLGTH